MRIAAIVQARMSSQRLPGKVLHAVCGKPMLQYLVERLERSSTLSEIVVATSTCESDQPIAEFCSRTGVNCFRGPLEDVAGRFNQVIEALELDAFVRVNGDSPLLDQRLIDSAVSIFREGEFEIVTNVLERTFPRGQSVEVVGADVFCSAFRRMADSEDLEHVTKFFYRNRDAYRILNFTSGRDLNGIHLSVDTANDMMRFGEMVAAMERPHWDYGFEELVALHDKLEATAERGLTVQDSML
ncbi:MAG TPA: NTP transferase domain-containing protein [Blastocatellia bacterium]|jgi:spore coat polysaccharide biosynthesis protein SpsF|nr:NTP transferase domain-containing protein [Blastocatellia bacterium]